MWLFLVALTWLFLPIVLILLLGIIQIFRTPSCPGCGGETLLLQSPLLQSALLRPLRRVVGVRWCLQCGWQGLARPPRRPLPLRNDAYGYRRIDAASVHPPRRGRSR